MSELRPAINIGYRVGMLTVSSKTDMRKNGYTIWLCRCDCGGEIMLDTRCLQRGTITDCGCRTKVKPGMLDLTGKRFGKLVCLKLSDEKDNSGNTQWVCYCDCGNICLAAVPQLRSGYKKSCGCLSHPPLKNFIGKRFNMLTVVEYAGKEAGMHRWRCVCDCGNETVVGQTLLQSGKTKSCGCLQSSQIKENMKFIDGTSVTALEARMSRAPISTNTSGYNGVYQNKKTEKWTAQIGFKGKTYHLGSFDVIQDAIKARQRAEEMMFEPFLEWYYDMNRSLRKERLNEEQLLSEASSDNTNVISIEREDKQMNKKELIVEIAHRTNQTQKDTEEILNSFCDIVGEELTANRKVQILGFGSFEVRNRAARKGKNPRTGEVVEIESSKAPAFKAGKALKDLVNL